nr:MAG TPA: hypothetical protein [Caudoviricetes sp.]
MLLGFLQMSSRLLSAQPRLSPQARRESSSTARMSLEEW